MKKLPVFMQILALLFSLTACGRTTAASADTEKTAPSPEIIVFAAASLQEALDDAIAQYSEIAPDVTVIATYDSSGTLLTQIKEGAPCDLFISASPKQIDALDGSLKDNTDKNPDGLDLIAESGRLDLLENQVVLAVPDGNPAHIRDFSHLADLLKHRSVSLAIGNSDVPVGQYTQKIFTHYGIDEASVSSQLTYASNVKEVTTQLSESTVDCGIIYATDAFSAGLTVIDRASVELCGRVVYPAAVLTCGTNSGAALAFLDYLRSETTLALFEAVGFSPAV